MNAKERTEQLIQRYSPHTARRRNVLYWILGSFGGPPENNKKRSIMGRTLDSYHELKFDLSFLAGMLTLLPLLNSARGVQYRDEGEKILSDANELIHSFLEDGNATVNLVRKMRVCGERIIRLRDKIQKEMKRSWIGPHNGAGP